MNATRRGECGIFLWLLLLLLRGCVVNSWRVRALGSPTGCTSLAVGFNNRELVTAELGRSNWHSCCRECSAVPHVRTGTVRQCMLPLSDVVVERYNDHHPPTHPSHRHTRRFMFPVTANYNDYNYYARSLHMLLSQICLPYEFLFTESLA